MNDYAPGSRMAMAGQNHAPTSADVAVSQSQLPAPRSMQPVPVRADRPEETIPRTAVVAASGTRQLLPQDPCRYRAVIMSIDQDVVLCLSKDQATAADNTIASVPQPAGFYLPKLVPITIESKGLLWVANTSTASATRVSVVTERYADAEPY
jgi:hypothetical protein